MSHHPAAEAVAERLSRAQLAAVNNQFWYLGYRRSDRVERLAVCAALLGLEDLASTRDLTPGQAGLLVRQLAQLRTRAEVEAAAEAARTARPARPVQLAGWPVGLVLAVVLARDLAQSRPGPAGQ